MYPRPGDQHPTLPLNSQPGFDPAGSGWGAAAPSGAGGHRTDPGASDPAGRAPGATRRLARWFAIAGAIAVLAGGGLLGLQLADSGASPSAHGTDMAVVSAMLGDATGSPGSGSARQPGCHRRAARPVTTGCHRLIRMLRALPGEHGQLSFSTKTGAHTVSYERGVITSVTAGTVVVRAADGTTWSWHLAGKTLVVSAAARKLVGAGALSPGQRVFVAGPERWRQQQCPAGSDPRGQAAGGITPGQAHSAQYQGSSQRNLRFYLPMSQDRQPDSPP